MIRATKKLDIEPAFDFDLVAPRERIVFFDIETTGLNASRSGLYLIGTVVCEDGCWVLRQFFAESAADETGLLAEFFGLIAVRRKLGRVVLISYNGDGFDIPFITKCVRQYRLDYDFSGTLSLDLIKKVRPYRGFAGLSDCRLKSVERHCGIFREDKFSGGELIYVYEEYLRLSALQEESCEYTPRNLKLKEKLLQTLLLHNAEDIADMPLIMDVLGYESLFEDGGFSVISSGILTVGNTKYWNIRARLKTPLPAGYYREERPFVLSISEDDKLSLNLAVELRECELKYFFADYKNYYYLPAEDYAIHKSVGEFVDRTARRQATARTCYQKRKGLFTPELSAVIAPVFREEYKSEPGYGLLDEKYTDGDGNVDFCLAESMLRSVLEAFRTRKNA